MRLICARLGASFEDSTIMGADNFGQDAMYSLNSDKARIELGWSPSTSLEQGIDQTVRWIDDNLAQLRRLPHDYVHQK